MAHQAEFERKWLVRQDASLWPLDQLVWCKQALNPNKRSLNIGKKVSPGTLGLKKAIPLALVGP